MMFTRTFTIVALLAVANAKNLRSNDPVLKDCDPGSCGTECMMHGATYGQCIPISDVADPNFNTMGCACCMCKTGVCLPVWPGTQCANPPNTENKTIETPDTVKEEIETPDTVKDEIETPDTDPPLTPVVCKTGGDELCADKCVYGGTCNDDGYCDCNQAPDDTVKKTNKTNDHPITPVVCNIGGDELCADKCLHGGTCNDDGICDCNESPSNDSCQCTGGCSCSQDQCTFPMYCHCSCNVGSSSCMCV